MGLFEQINRGICNINTVGSVGESDYDKTRRYINEIERQIDHEIPTVSKRTKIIEAPIKDETRLALENIRLKYKGWQEEK